MGFSRIPRTRAETLSRTFYDGETPTDSTATVTVAVTDAAGTSVASGNAASAGAGTGRYTFALPAQSQVAELTVTWTATINGASVVESDTVEICGGHLFELAVARAYDSSLADTAAYPTSALAWRRDQVTSELEYIQDRAWTTRYARVTLDGPGTSEILLAHPTPDRTARDVTAIRAASIAPEVDGTPVALTAAQLAAVAVRPDGSLRRTDGNVWTEGSSNIVIEYEYGRGAPPPDLLDAMYVRLRYMLQRPASAVDERADSRTTADGTTYRMADVGPYTTGMPEVDGPYQRYSHRPTASADDGGMRGQSAPAGRALIYRPQRYSLFH